MRPRMLIAAAMAVWVVFIAAHASPHLTESPAVWAVTVGTNMQGMTPVNSTIHYRHPAGTQLFWREFAVSAAALAVVVAFTAYLGRRRSPGKATYD